MDRRFQKVNVPGTLYIQSGRSSLIGLAESSKKRMGRMAEEDSSDSFKSADSPELRNVSRESPVSGTHRGEPLTESAFTVFAQSVFIKELTEEKFKKKSTWKKILGRDKVHGESKVMSQNTGKKERPRGRGTTPAGKASTSLESAENPKPPSSPQPDEEALRKSAEVASQIIQQKKEEGKRVSGDDLRKQLTEGLKNGSGKSKDVKAQISDITQNAVKTSAVASEAFLESEKGGKEEPKGVNPAQESSPASQDDPKGDPPSDGAVPSTSTSSDPIVPPPESKKEHLYKILVIGELGTGKTSIIKRYVHQFFSQHYRATIGVDFALKVLNWDENSIIRLQLWDIAGQERFGNMTRVYYKEAVGAFIVFDVTRAATFDAVQKWKQDLDSKVQLSDGSQIPCILLANKCDQPKEGIVNNKNKMDEYCKENGFAGWFETSAKENINIEDAAKSLVVKILQNDKLIRTGERGVDDRIALDGSSESGSSKTCNC